MEDSTARAGVLSTRVWNPTAQASVLSAQAENPLARAGVLSTRVWNPTAQASVLSAQVEDSTARAGVLSTRVWNLTAQASVLSAQVKNSLARATSKDVICTSRLIFTGLGILSAQTKDVSSQASELST
ncbi:hypothetical protein [Ureibacillus sp. FSL K6-2830]|uniref:hypothetical protein n=1 Tax=Ureibacillus sp. FSL K6-2830 TaxID=2954610 RepID=UPI0030FCC4C2